jgi:hypothetical protein
MIKLSQNINEGERKNTGSKCPTHYVDLVIVKLVSIMSPSLWKFSSFPNLYFSATEFIEDAYYSYDYH